MPLMRLNGDKTRPFRDLFWSCIMGEGMTLRWLTLHTEVTGPQWQHINETCQAWKWVTLFFFPECSTFSLLACDDKELSLGCYLEKVSQKQEIFFLSLQDKGDVWAMSESPFCFQKISTHWGSTLLKIYIWKSLQHSVTMLLKLMPAAYESSYLARGGDFWMTNVLAVKGKDPNSETQSLHKSL